MKLFGSCAALLLAAVAVSRPAGAVASAELYRTQAYVYGRFEARIRYAAGDGVISSFFLWKEGSELSNAYWNELDFEKLGADCHMQTNAIYGNPEAEHSQTNAIPADICAGYHDYRFEWTPDYIAWAVDGREIRRETGATATAFRQNAASGMTFRFNVWPGNANFGGNFNPAILPVHQYISWVQYSSYANGAFQLAWREEFSGGTLPSGWATGNWASPYNLSTHDAANVRFVDGIAILSLTADNATGFTGVPPADVAGVGGAGAGGAGTGGVTNAVGGAGTGGVTATGGKSATGGRSAGVGGALAPSGGTTTSAGGAVAPSGGRMANTGGAQNSGGATAGGASSSGTTTANGGASSTSVGATGASTSTSASGGTPITSVGGSIAGGGMVGATAMNTPDQDGGCACKTAGRASRGWPYGAVGLLGVVLGMRRRRRLRMALR